VRQKLSENNDSIPVIKEKLLTRVYSTADHIIDLMLKLN
jgi:hypothetical protein